MMFFRREKKIRKETAGKPTILNRILIEDLIDQGYTCQEAAEQAGCTEKDVYTVKQAKKRREITMKQPQNDPEDPVTKAKMELATMQVELQKLDLERKRIELQQQLQELKEQALPEEEEAAGESETGLLTALLSGFMNRQQPQQTQPQAAIFSPPLQQHMQQQQKEIQQVLQVMPEQTLDDSEIIGMLDQIPQKHLKAIQKMPDSLIVKTAKGYFPGFSEETYTRALELLKQRRL